MKNIIISNAPMKEIIAVFFAGLLGAGIAGIFFGFIGLIFANYLGFNLLAGAEEIGMGESAIFYSILATPVGALVGTLLASKLIGYKHKLLYSALTSLAVIIIGLFLRIYFSLYTLAVYSLLSSLGITTSTVGFGSKPGNQTTPIK